MKEFAKRLNFFSTSFISILGFSLISEIFMENDLEDKLDDIGILILGIVSIFWYKRKGSNTSSAKGSVVLIGVGLIIKIIGIIIEHADKEALGDDIGIVIALIMAFSFIFWQVISHRSEK